ncbi:MAG TPA: DUF362 domain-containing protein [Bryobacteraceae bacterium]|nr:DUF362 domain-containing protein [Bryobacteraceae bacterium]
MAKTGVRVTRRGLLPLAGLAAGVRCSSPPVPAGPPGNAAVFIAKAPSYEVEIATLIEEGIRACGLAVKGKRVLLKPNLVEFDSSTSINTHVVVLGAALEVFRKLGAGSVRIGEGPGHRRDTVFLAEEARYRSLLPKFDEVFVDLNRDDVSAIPSFAGQEKFYFPNTALGADLIVSVAKMKTHHWAGATLSMKNFFGLTPGAVYGWPKNILHRIGIAQSIVELNKVFSRSFAIVDGIVGMEGNGPIQGTSKPCGVLVMGTDLAAVDATCCRIMGINPEKLEYLRLTRALGHIDPSRIEQRGERIERVRNTFQLIDEFQHVRAG